jgi:hypothetical protein
MLVLREMQSFWWSQLVEHSDSDQGQEPGAGAVGRSTRQGQEQQAGAGKGRGLRFLLLLTAPAPGSCFVLLPLFFGTRSAREFSLEGSKLSGSEKRRIAIDDC